MSVRVYIEEYVRVCATSLNIAASPPPLPPTCSCLRGRILDKIPHQPIISLEFRCSTRIRMWNSFNSEAYAASVMTIFAFFRFTPLHNNVYMETQINNPFRKQNE